MIDEKKFKQKTSAFLKTLSEDETEVFFGRMVTSIMVQNLVDHLNFGEKEYHAILALIEHWDDCEKIEKKKH